MRPTSTRNARKPVEIAPIDAVAPKAKGKVQIEVVLVDLKNDPRSEPE